MRRFIIFIFSVSLLGFSSCEKDVDPVDILTDNEVARNHLYTLMDANYLWYKLMPVVVKEDYADPYELMEAMRYKTLDRWSHVQTYDDYLAQSQAVFVGHGIRIGLDQTDKTRIAQIYKNSPLYASGIRRGWIIKKINGTDLAPIFIAEDNEAYRSLIGPSEAGITNTFLFHTPEGKDSTVTTTKASFTLNTVIHYDTLILKSGITGHLVFDQFIPPSNAELAAAFSFFKENNITDLIIDLRYNGGGDVSVLTNLASYIAGSSKFGKPYLNFVHNDKQTAKNKILNFNTVAYPLSLTRMITICTRGTASASEQLINGLKPFIDVRCIGDTTNGKPVGMYGFTHNQDYIFWPISFAMTNMSDEGDFYEGFFPEKYVPDDIAHDFDDRKESCLKEAIYYLENGSVSSKSSYPYRPTVQFTESPKRNNDAYLIEIQ